MSVAHQVSHDILMNLLEGNRRFRTGHRQHQEYHPDRLLEIAETQEPLAGVITCSDSRVNADLVFDQPLGTLFASRVPGNVAADSSLWMVDIAVSEFKVPIIMVMGHTRCLAVGQLLNGDNGGPGGIHRSHIRSAVLRSQQRHSEDPYREAIIENTVQTVDRLVLESDALRQAMHNRTTVVVGSLYEMETGMVNILTVRDSVF